MGLKKISQFLTGNSEPWSFNFKEVFSKTFKKQSINTISQNDVSSIIPKPWKWLRVFLFLLLLSFIYYTIIYSGRVILAFPWFALVTASIIPISVAVFLYESNIKESVSILHILVIFFAGTAVAFFALININVGVGNEAIYVAFIAPIIEEIAKMAPIIIAIVLLKTKRLSSAVLIGWVVGAGFQIAETLGYATFFGLQDLFPSQDAFAMPDASTLIFRSIFAFGSHGFFGAIEGAAFYLSHKQENQKFNTKRFLVWVGLSVILHMLWNSSATFISSDLLRIIVFIILQIAMVGVFVYLYDACLRDNKSIIPDIIKDDTGIVVTETEHRNLVN